jgi:hypothetical protein
MKEFQLSTPTERILGISFSSAMIACMGLLLFALRDDIVLLIMCGLGILLISALLGFYMISILKSVCLVDTEKKILEVKGYPSYTKDVSKAVLLQTMQRKSGQTVSRVLVFSDAEENIVAVIPTLFTLKRGVMAEPMAKEMAKALGIEFQENVPAWEYDKEKFKEHQKEEEEAEKLARKENAERRKKKLQYRIQKRIKK